MLSAVILVYNEGESLALLYQEIQEVAKANSADDLEIVFVDDTAR